MTKCTKLAHVFEDENKENCLCGFFRGLSDGDN